MKSLNNFSTVSKISQPQLPGYIFSEKLGSGSYAVVYKACSKLRSQEVVAVKCILRSSLNNISKENLLTEIELMKSFKHEHIVNLIDFSWDETYIYLILEYCAGGDLMSFLKSHRIVSERVAKMFLQQLASGLEYMRSKLVSHMDLKPSNILLTSTHNPIVKIADFGFAQYLSGSTDAMFVRGSLLYMAPEIATRGSYDEKADLWSVGVLLYECLYGRAPFASRTLTELEAKIRSSDPIEIPSKASSSSKLISESCLDLLEGLLKRNVDERMGYDEFFIHPFVDLIHLPTKNSLRTATELVSKAIAMDDRKNYKSALRFYCESLQYFMAAVQFETDCRKKEAVRSKVNEYIERAEELKKLLETDVTSEVAAEEATSADAPTPEPSTSNSSDCKKTSNNEDSYSQLLELYKDSESMIKALNVIKSAEAKEMSENFKSALQRYEVALGVILRLTGDEPNSFRKDVLKSQMSIWMSRAERIKQYLILKESKQSDASGETASLTDDMKYYSCLVQ